MENMGLSFSNSKHDRSLPNATFWKGKRVLVTGHTGFKGAWLTIWLKRLGADVIGISLSPTSSPNLFELASLKNSVDNFYCDIQKPRELLQLVRRASPDIVFHLAAQALVLPGYADPLSTFNTNVMGTAHVLDAVRQIDTVRVVVSVTTDKVYRNVKQKYPFRETDALGGHDPYSASKAASELIIASYRDAYLLERGTAVASARAGNVIGGGDWSENRLIPDAVRAWSSGKELYIRRPRATRPWQHVLEPLSGYLILAEKLWSSPSASGAYNFGPETHEAATVKRVVELARAVYKKGAITWGGGDEGFHESDWLALEIAKSRSDLCFRPHWSLEEAVTKTMNWYFLQQQGENVRSLCEVEISEYEALT